MKASPETLKCGSDLAAQPTGPGDSHPTLVLRELNPFTQGKIFSLSALLVA